MKQKDIIELSDTQLTTTLDEQKTQLTRSRMSHAISPIENPARLNQQRKTIARIKTEIRSREIKATEQQVNN
ncbi:MAG: 50S ribosomal protein L29 [Bacteroidota bacterium]|nr:50S ribosomal protein L29 [Bacteroidota bacterium]